jgi:hypothetical protein
MWQGIIVGIVVIAAAVYAARTLGPRRWRFKARGNAGAGATANECGCTKDGKSCH